MSKGVKILFLVIAVATVTFVTFSLEYANKVAKSGEEVVEQTIDTDNVLYNYENFKDLYNEAKAQVAKIESAEEQKQGLKETHGEPKEFPEDIRKELADLNENIAGFEKQYQSIVKQYNSDSSKLNRNLFKDDNLPAELPLYYQELKD